jgi:hypothetical protein
MSNEAVNVRRCDQMHDAKENKQDATTAKYPGVSRCGHETYKIRCLNAISPD